MNSRPKTTNVTYGEGTFWQPFIPWKPGQPIAKAVHSIRFANGWEWDIVNGWRAEKYTTYKE